MTLRWPHRATGARLVVCARTVGLLVSLAVATSASAADTRSIRFQHYAQDDGLSQSFVYTILQDARGYMWFGTQEGLNRFDGFEFVVFAHDPTDPTTISDESIRTMIEDSAGVLWVGTDAGGLSRYSPHSGTFTNFLHDPTAANSISDNRVRVIYEDNSRILWVGTDGSGLDRFDRNTSSFTHFPYNPLVPGGISNGNVWDIVEDSAGSLWVATENGLNKLDRETGQFTRYMHDPKRPKSLSDNKLRILYEDTRGNLWVGTEEGGLNLFHRDTGDFEHFRHDPADQSSISSDRINVIFEDASGVLWIGTVAGLNAWDPVTRSFDRYAHDPADRYSLPHNNVLSMYQDRSGVLWVGSYDGISRWSSSARAMLHYRKHANDDSALNENTVTAFAESSDGDIWVGTFGGGVNRLERATGHFSQLRHVADDRNSLSSDHVMALLSDSADMLWVGTRAAGLNRRVDGSDSFVRFQHDPADPFSISANGITAIHESSDKRLWVGTFGGGLNIFDRSTEKFTRIQHDPENPNTLSNDRVLVIFEDGAGMLWVGTYGGGLNCIDPETGIIAVVRADPQRADGLSGDEIYMIQEDTQGNLWIAAKGAGLNLWSAEDRAAGKIRFERFTERHGLPSATIYSGVWDDTGSLWLSTAHGISRLDPETRTFRNFDTSHGLQGDEFNLAAGFRASDGLLLFGGLNGFNAFRPALLGGARRSPPVVITKFTSLKEPIDLPAMRASGSIPSLDHLQNVISFEYAALDFAAPEKNRYMYRLDGLDRHWTDAGFKRQVTYTNLPAGEYSFRVRAQNNDNVWSEEDAIVRFTVEPAPWLTWWAYLIYATFLVGILILAQRAQKRNAARAAKLEFIDELSLLEFRLSEAQRIAGIGNWDWDIVTNELWWSDEIYRLFQLPSDEFGANYESFLAAVHPDDRNAVDRAVQRALRDEKPYSIDHRIVRQDGTERVVHERGEVSFDDSGKPLRMVGTVHDITERKMAEEDIHRRATFQQLLANLSSELIRARPYDIDQQLTEGLAAVADYYDLDVISLWRIAEDRDSMRCAHRWDIDQKRARKSRISRSEIPWIAAKLSAGETVVIDDVDRMPIPATTDQKVLSKRGKKSTLIIPLYVEGDIEGSCVFSTSRERRSWSTKTVTELQLIAETLISAISRTQAVVEIAQLKDQLQAENFYLREEVKLAHGFDEIVGENRDLRKCLQSVEKVAPTDLPVLVLGETGTGKELIARAVHKLSNRRDKPMVSVNCPSLPANLIESELFGHEKGAFTGAESARQGRFDLADGGTLFLDEIGELPLDLQVKLLRVLQTGEYQRLGGTRTLRADVRLIAATNRNLEHAIELGEFRSDLYFRIASFPIRLPPLRKREGDIPLLAEHFVHKHAKRLGKNIEAISAKMLQELVNYDWPGNVRELESIVERSLISATSGSVLELPGPLRATGLFEQPKDSSGVPDDTDLVSVERAHILSVLDKSNWKIAGSGGAAAALGIPPSTLRSKMKRLGITKRET